MTNSVCSALLDATYPNTTNIGSSGVVSIVDSVTAARPVEKLSSLLVAGSISDFNSDRRRHWPATITTHGATMVRKFRRRDRQQRPPRHPDFSTTLVKSLWVTSRHKPGGDLYEPVDSPLLREWEGPVNIKARLNFGQDYQMTSTISSTTRSFDVLVVPFLRRQIGGQEIGAIFDLGRRLGWNSSAT